MNQTVINTNTSKVIHIDFSPQDLLFYVNTLQFITKLMNYILIKNHMIK
jgi:hypothetical protein